MGRRGAAGRVSSREGEEENLKVGSADSPEEELLLQGAPFSTPLTLSSTVLRRAGAGRPFPLLGNAAPLQQTDNVEGRLSRPSGGAVRESKRLTGRRPARHRCQRRTRTRCWTRRHSGGEAQGDAETLLPPPGRWSVLQGDRGEPSGLGYY